jgi:hypothetical protein
VVLKYADRLHGADKAIANAIGFNSHVNAGDHVFVPGMGIGARQVLFIGVGPKSAFRYELIQEFGSRAIKLAQSCGEVRHLALTIHGPGYGLDPEESFLSMIAGIISEWKQSRGPLEHVTVAEISEKRCELIKNLLQDQLKEFGLDLTEQRSTVTIASTLPQSSVSPASDNIVQFGMRADRKPRLFVAMPFSDQYDDEYHIGFIEAAREHSFVCERLDQQNYVGDVFAEIKKRIIESHCVIALLNGHNPNVFLEIGFALAHQKPIILVAKEGVELPFDVSGHFCLVYKNIVQLRQNLSKRIASLRQNYDSSSRIG